MLVPTLGAEEEQVMLGILNEAKPQYLLTLERSKTCVHNVYLTAVSSDGFNKTHIAEIGENLGLRPCCDVDEEIMEALNLPLDADGHIFIAPTNGDYD